MQIQEQITDDQRAAFISYCHQQRKNGSWSKKRYENNLNLVGYFDDSDTSPSDVTALTEFLH